MNTALLRGAMRAAGPGVRIVVAATAVVLLPALTIVGVYFTVLLLFTLYPLFLISAYIIVDWHMAARLVTIPAAPRWHTALSVGLGTALALTRALLITSALGALALASIFGAISLFSATITRSLQNGRLMIEVAGGFIGIYLAGTLVIGLPCAWLGAWLGLRLQHRRDRAPKYGDFPAGTHADTYADTRMLAADVAPTPELHGPHAGGTR